VAAFQGTGYERLQNEQKAFRVSNSEEIKK
jgi:hypothetical protein